MRVPGMDAFRGLSVLSMLLVHVAKVLPAAECPWRAGVGLLEPLVSACFLFLVGWGLGGSWWRACREGAGGWYRRCLVRAGALYALGISLFVLQYGPEFPDLLFSPDILSCIAWAIVIVGALLPRGVLGLTALGVLVLALGLCLELVGLSVSGVNAGPGGVIPLLAFASLGASVRLEELGRGSFPRAFVAVALLAALGATLLPGGLVTQHAASYAGLWFWNHSTKGVLVLAGPLLLGSLMFARYGGASFGAPLRLLGRHALVVYVGHLLVLGALQSWFGTARGALALPATLLGLVALCVGVASLLEVRTGRTLRAAVAQRVGVRL